jgi:ribosomal protein S18 acetylase RimI-like enzyme
MNKENEPTNKSKNCYSVKTATILDRQLVEGIVRQCGKQVSDYFGIRNLVDFYRKKQVYWIEDTQPIGFAIAKPLIKQEVISLYEIGVIPSMRGMGVASALLYHINDLYPNRSWRLVVNEDNQIARIAYQRLGLKEYAYDKTRGGRPIVRMEGRLKLKN